MNRYRLFLAVGWVLLAWPGLAQSNEYYPLFQQEYFFGTLPSARAEAMGRTGVALGGDPSAYYNNAAGIGTIDTWAAEVSTSAPYYVLRESDYYFASFVKRLHPKVVAGLHVHRFGVGPTTFTLDIAGEDFELDKAAITDLAATVAYEPLDGLHLGVNAHFYNWKNFEDVPAFRSFYLDAGALYERPLANGAELRLGASVLNLNGADITMTSPIGTSSSNVFPIIARAGIAYDQRWQVVIPGAGEQSLQLLLTTEYQDVLNGDVRTAFRFGSELTLADVLIVRLGLFTRSEDDLGFQNNRDRISDVTYGFGLLIPVEKMSDGRWPVQLRLDYYSLESPPAVFSGTRLPNKRGVGIRVISSLSAN